MTERRTTRAVLDEIRAGVTARPALEGLLHLDWLEAVPIDGLPELIVFSDLRRRFGHGVGMRQVGAIGRAEAGQDYRTILGHYYNGAEVRKIY